MTPDERRPNRKNGAPPEPDKLTDEVRPCGVCPYAGRDPAAVTRHAVRVIQDALAEGSATYWQRRAATFEAARPRPGDFTGDAAPEQLLARDARLVAIVRACHAGAAVARMGGPS